jgi:general secretion pathway protein D
MSQKSTNWLLLALIVILFGGCATDDLLGRKPTSTENMSDANEKLKQNPQSADAKAQQANAQYSRINQLLTEAENARKANNADEARSKYEEVLKIEKGNQRAQAGLSQLQTQSRHQLIVAEASQLLEGGNLDGARTKLRTVLIENPMQMDARILMQEIEDKSFKDQITPRKLKPPKNSTVTLEFRDANLRNIFEVISRTCGINFVFDPTIRPDLKASIFVKDASVEEVIDFLLLTQQLGKKVLTENSLLIFPQNRAAQYEDLTLRTYYLNYADAKQTASFIKSMLPIKDVYIDEKLNMLSVKAAFEQVQNVERLIANSDVPDPEVVLDVEILDVQRSKLTDIGIIYPDTFTVLGSNGASSTTDTPPLTVNDLKNITSKTISVSPAPAIRLLLENGDANLLANPRVRVKSREKAKIHIGDKIPITVTTITSGNSGFATESANYIDVGLKLDVEPRVLLNNDVSMKINLEVSNAVTPAGASFPTLSTRNATTVLMTGDGETQVLAGLISNSDRENAKKVPGLGDLPLIGRLFTDKSGDKRQMEVVMLITPHVVRNLLRPEAGTAEFYGGTGGRTAPLNINPTAILQQMTGVPQAPLQQAPRPGTAPAAPTAPTENKAPEIPEGAPRPIGKPLGEM